RRPGARLEALGTGPLQAWSWWMTARGRVSRPILAASLLVAPSALPVFAQLDRGQIAGFVKDETGGVIPGATVTATHTQTGAARIVYTDATGYYVFTTLTPGTYDIVVELPGFKQWKQT